MFSCSSDGHIGRFTHRKSIFSKFRISGESKKHKFFSVSLHPSEDTILVGASAKFFWIDLDTQVVLKAFGGHKGDITSLSILTTSAKLPPFVVSVGGNEQDHTVAIWKLDDEVQGSLMLFPDRRDL